MITSREEYDETVRRLAYLERDFNQMTEEKRQRAKGKYYSYLIRVWRQEILAYWETSKND